MPSLAFAGEEGAADEAESASEDLSLALSSGYIADWTISGTCEWSIDADGNLVVRPANGASEGTLEGSKPWTGYYDQIKTARFEGTVHVLSAAEMFGGCRSLASVDLSGLDTSQAISMSKMFSFCSSLTSIDLSGIDTANVTDMSEMFEHCYRLTALDVSAFNTSNVVDMSCAFSFLTGLTSLDVSNLDTSKVTDMRDMFWGCGLVEELDVSNFDTSKVTDMSYMFADCDSLKELDLSSFDTANVTTMSCMFSDSHNASSLTSLDVLNFDTSNVTSMHCMFRGCSSLESLDLSRFDTSNVTDMELMFYRCSSLTSLDLSSFDTPSVTDMYEMFAGCSSLASLDLSSFNTSNVTKMGLMFYDCSSLESLNLSSFDTSNVVTAAGMFAGCSSLTYLNLSSFDTSKIQYWEIAYLASPPEGWFDRCESLRTVEVGSGFNFVSTKGKRCSLPTPSGDGLTGKWVSSADGVAYAADAIPNNVAATYTAETQGASGQTVFRMYNPITSEHLFTTDESEYESLITENWQKEGEAWSSPTSGKGVYRLYNAGLGALAKMSHHYTTDEAEVKLLTEQYGWVADNDGNPIFYSAEDESGNALEGASPVYRLYNGGLSAHHYTLDKDENDLLTDKHGWSGEGVGFYAVKTNSAGVE